MKDEAYPATRVDWLTQRLTEMKRTSHFARCRRELPQPRAGGPEACAAQARRLREARHRRLAARSAKEVVRETAGELAKIIWRCHRADGWLAPRGQFHHVGRPLTLLFEGCKVGGFATAALLAMMKYAPALFDQLEAEFRRVSPTTATAAGIVEGFALKHGFARVRDGGDWLELEGNPNPQQLAVVEQAASLTDMELRLL